MSRHITSLVINSLGGGHTNTHTNTHTDIRTGTILRNQAHASRRPARTWFKNAILKKGIGIKSEKVCIQVRDQIVWKQIEEQLKGCYRMDINSKAI